MEFDVAGGYLGEVVVDLGSCGYGFDGVVVFWFCSVGGFIWGVVSGEVGVECEGVGVCENVL